MAAPLAQLYHSQLHLQLECPTTPNATSSNAKQQWMAYRGSYALDELPIHQDIVLTIPLQRHSKQEALVTAASAETSPPPTTSTPDTPSTTNTNNSNTILLRVQVRLEGPRRSEIVKAHQALATWLLLVDRVEDVLCEVWRKVSPQIPHAAKKKEALLLILPAMLGLMVPLVTVCVVLSPLAIGFCLLFFPIMIPLVVGVSLLVVISVLGSALIISGLYASSRHGRHALAKWWQSQTTLQSYWNIARGPRFGLQTFYYATGPRPTPVTLTRTQLPKEKWRRLGVSLTIDGVGSFSYLLPFVGEVFDVVWAPTQTVLIMALYQHVSPNMSYVSFAEEMLPFLDVLPSATTGWLMEFGPELLEDAKAAMKNPSATATQLQTLLWGTPSPAVGRSSSTRNMVSGNRRSLPKARPSRNA